MSSTQRVEADLTDDPYGLFEVEATYHPATPTVRVAVAGEQLEMKLSRPLQAIRYVGYGAANTVTGFSEIAIGR